MKVILLENVDNIGLPGQTADVRPGYYRNFLLPRSLAVEATASNLKGLEHKRKKLEKEAERIMGEARSTGDRLREVSLKFVEKVADQGKLFGSVTAGDIQARLAELGFDIDRRKIGVDHIKTVGKFTANIKLHTTLSVPITILVEGIAPPAPAEDEKAEAEAPEAEAEETPAETPAS